MKIRTFDRDDMHTMLAIQSKTAQTARWTEADYTTLAFSKGGMILIAELETMTPPKILGFAAFQRLIDEAEVMNIAVAPEHQQQGVGKAILEEAKKKLLEAGAKRLFLEVRQSNQSALRLYYSVGFRLHSIRKDYYREPAEDANVLSLDL